MKPKIGIITFQRAHNYGAILQCYALQEMLLANHYDVQVIDYYPQSMHYYYYFQWNRFAPWHPFGMMRNIFLFRRRVLRYNAFNKFINKNLILSNHLNTIAHDYDVIIIGSDQLWNPKNSSGKYDDYYWGKFKRNNLLKIISYAVSMGKSWKVVDWKVVNDLLSNFDAISVREDYLKDAIKEMCHRQVDVVLDPTLLQERSFWMNKSKDLRINRPYLFFYQARANKFAYRYAKTYALKRNLDFICLSADIISKNSRIAIDADTIVS